MAVLLTIRSKSVASQLSVTCVTPKSFHHAPGRLAMDGLDSSQGRLG
jgi:hypothetical protein